MQEKYIPKEIEKKWQAQWATSSTFEVQPNRKLPKFYVLEMLPYPSGRIHIGHVRNYSIGDAYAWYKRLNGFNVLHPMGWDSFGMPAENAAIKNGSQPDSWTISNIETMRNQLKKMGFSYDWSREIASSTPEYYRWNQWFFIQLFKKGLVYRKKATVNWCKECQTSLANEQAESGFCWRHSETPVELRELEQWFVKLTNYNEELLDGIENILQGNWPDKVLTMQRNWIGRSTGAFVDFLLVDDASIKIRIFTTHIETIHGANACIISPDHSSINKVLEISPNKKTIEKFIDEIKNIPPAERKLGNFEKDGVDTGITCINPFTEQELPIWISNFVLSDYGTGAIMSVPAHDERDYEFSLKFNLPIPCVVWPENENFEKNEIELPFTGSGFLGPMCKQFSGLSSEKAQKQMTAYAQEQGFGEGTVTYRIRDWGISRQRAWGTPIPMIHCEKCGIVPVSETQLPIRLPQNLDFSLGAPLAQCKEYIETNCPQCSNPARRDTDTMDTFIDSNWYYFRYCDPQNSEKPFDPEVVRYWMPVDFYIGGVEHAVMHLIYTRAWTMTLRDLGLVEFSEPIKKLLTQGMVILNGAKMSKSLGNIVDPDEMIERYGADATRLSILFAAPPEKEVDWKQITDESGNTNYPAAEGAMRYLSRVWRLVHKWQEHIDSEINQPFEFTENQRNLRRVTHQSIKRTTEAYEHGLHLNVTVAICMELTNTLYEYSNKFTDNKITEAALADLFVLREGIHALLIMLAPLAPHVTSELFESLESKPLIEARWPQYQEELTQEEKIEIPIQINGKIKSKIFVASTISENLLKETALADSKVQSILEGQSIIKIIVVPKRLLNIVTSK